MNTISPQEVVEILRARGTHVSEQEAKIILEFMYKLAEITLTQYLHHENSRSVCPGKH